MEKEEIKIPSVTLEWSEWFPWEKFKLDLRSGHGVRVPKMTGVYEVKLRDSEERLTIGRASNLHMRVKVGLVKGNIPHSTGEKIRENEDTSKIVVRWATTDRPACVEEELHDRHRYKFGGLPKHTSHT